ncbi:MAG: hypothetical protein VR68_04055 [Peptococcaceae bacterium BRH_c4a]|nr:MAG: hypothetical protein VR68_04055 [Peptococcaceae bacterium BRH_c4a]
MDSLFTTVLLNTLSLKVLMVMVIGILAGILVGTLPGFQANMGVALLLPLTFGMSADTGIIMLVSLYAAAIYGGSITAILFSTPGTTASAATAIEGFELTKQGKSGTAIRIATWCSAIGGMVGAFSLLFISPPLSLISLKFGPPEYFLIAVFGLITIASIASGSLLVKGLIAGSVGFLLSTVGLDLDSGYPRFIFGMSFLASGISFVPAVIGLFALSQVLAMVTQDSGSMGSGVAHYDKKDWKFFITLDELRQVKNTIMRSLGIGMVIGVLPGAGADVAAWVSYHEAKRFSKHPEKFGKGAIDGIAAAEVAKNTECGGALIPLLTLGIPGSTTAAILLGALVMHGLVPGRDLFTKYAEITYTIIIGFILANFLMAVIGMAVSRHIAKLTNINIGILAPVIVTLTVIGSYALGNNIYDVWTMVAFGILGYFMKNHGYHPAALVLGLILGPMAEKGFRQSLVLSNGNLLEYFFTRPISVTLIVLIVLTMVGPLLMEKRRQWKARIAG